jgi:hypothetical protein
LKPCRGLDGPSGAGPTGKPAGAGLAARPARKEQTGSLRLEGKSRVCHGSFCDWRAIPASVKKSGPTRRPPEVNAKLRSMHYGSHVLVRIGLLLKVLE